jgi:hypothetical protein
MGRVAGGFLDLHGGCSIGVGRDPPLRACPPLRKWGFEKTLPSVSCKSPPRTLKTEHAASPLSSPLPGGTEGDSQIRNPQFAIRNPQFAIRNPQLNCSSLFFRGTIQFPASLPPLSRGVRGDSYFRHPPGCTLAARLYFSRWLYSSRPAVL